MPTIGCRLPMGLVLELKDRPSETVELRGQNKSKLFIPQTGYLPHYVGVTQVPDEIWSAWKKEHADSPLLKEKLIFEAKDEAAAERQALEFAGIKTGFQQLDPEKEGVKKAEDK